MLSDILKKHCFTDINKIRKIDFISAQLSHVKDTIEKVEKGHGWKSVDRCPLCGHKQSECELEKMGTVIVKCLQCDLRYSTRIPRNLADIYEDENYELGTKVDDQDHFIYRRDRFGRERVKILEEACGSLKEKKLLDIGCGNGFFLDAAKDYFNCCVGVDDSGVNREKAKINTGLQIHGGSLDKIPDKNFDVITAFNVLEHVEHPLEFVRCACDLLQSGGYLYLYSPNFNSLSIKVLKEYSFLIGVEHLTLFTRASLEYLGNLLNMDIVFIKTYGLDIFDIISFQEYSDEEECQFLVKWANELQSIVDAANAADGLRVMFRKPL
jgi:2-polyprenyl-3-methyl-5-hydroxy-6-metoxy-1,4-benzoquinol methylase